jgi:hypothetical protein
MCSGDDKASQQDLKSETRNSKSETGTKFESSKHEIAAQPFWSLEFAFSDLFRISHFRFRIFHESLAQICCGRVYRLRVPARLYTATVPHSRRLRGRILLEIHDRGS